MWTVSGTNLHFADWTDWTGWTCIEVDYCGGWLCFVCSLSMIGGVTALIGSKLRSRALHFESKRKRENEEIRSRKFAAWLHHRGDLAELCGCTACSLKSFVHSI